MIKKIIKNKYNENIICEINKADKPKNKTILILHAYTGKKENRTIHFLAKNLPKHKFNTIQFDFSGHGESEGKMQEATISKQLEDISSVLAQINEVPLNNLILVGNSFSVITALAFAKEDAIKGLILISGRANYLKYIDTLEKIGDRYKLFEGIFIRESFIEDYKKYDPIKNIKELNKPILIIHGERDNIIPVTDAKILLKNSKIGKLKIIKNADHRYLNPIFKEEVLKECVKFLDE